MVEAKPSTNALITKATRKKDRSPNGFVCADDGAARLFGTDVRLRNLMALAKYGPLYLPDLGRIANAGKVTVEGRDNAPFGRAGLVRVWETSGLRAAALDPTFPPYAELVALLQRLEMTYPLTYTPRRASPKAPPLTSVWNGDCHCLFGGEIATSILMTIGVLGWTFESLCVATTVGYDRVVVKKALKRLEDEGILSSSRSRRPGFNVRVIGLSATFPGHDELQALLRRCVEVWPDFGIRTRTALNLLSPRTKEHLRRRHTATSAKHIDFEKQEQRDRCIFEYKQLTKQTGAPISSNTLSSQASNLYRRIRKYWGTTAEFRKEGDVRLKNYGSSSHKNSRLKARCLNEYVQLTRNLGHEPNSSELTKFNPYLCQRIIIQWGGFPEFCEELRIAPKGRHRSTKSDILTKQNICREEYRALVMRLGYAPSSWELRMHTDGLYKRIRKVWPSFEAFCDEIGVEPPRRHRRSLPNVQTNC